jgi:hypothetical protein
MANLAQVQNKICYDAVYMGFRRGERTAIKWGRTNFREPSINI